MRMEIQSKRACRALGIVACLVALVPLSAQALDWAGSTAGFARTMEEIVNASTRGNAGDAEDVVGGYAQAFGIETSAAVSESFRQECFDPSDEEGLMVSNEGSLVGYRKDGECEDVFLSLAERLQENGWTWVKSGDDAQATFVKDEGALRWLYAVCTDSDSGTSVVIQVVSNE